MNYYYSFYDRSSEDFGPLFPAKSDKIARFMATASVKHMLETKQPVFPEDLELYCIGLFNEDDGHFENEGEGNFAKPRRIDWEYVPESDKKDDDHE